ncbi:MAG TPA: CBS domain-containing protein [Verrucomicrobiae bacterium]|jgi:CBS domain-containing protein|nr:CBS domain-containing protein [Verrucomicrobiae bacterium]
MKIQNIMTHKVEVIHPDTPLQQAAATMKRLDVGMLPVCDGEQLIGMLTDRDITVRATAEGLDPTKTPAEQVMTKEVCYCFDTQEVEQAVKLMEQKQIRRLPIVDHAKKLVGVMSLGDVAVRNKNKKLAAEAIEQVSIKTNH